MMLSKRKVRIQALIIIEAHGKTRAWSRISSALGYDAKLVATSGHLCRFPESLFPLGIRISKGHAIDVSRTPRPDIEQRIRNAVSSLRPGAEIIIASDDDPEGDVIALDVMRIIVDIDPLLIDQCLRVRPSAITKEGLAIALKYAKAHNGDLENLVSRAVAGRTRALTDRWMGATYSRLAKAGCGRVRAGILGSVFCWTRSPEVVRGVPETGEITLQARSSAGGLPFASQVTLHGNIPSALADVALRYKNKLIPGYVKPMVSIGAAVAPRFRNVALFNTGDALAYASRMHGVGPRPAMAGLQSAYMKGRISYPRTDNRTLSEGSALAVVQAAHICGLMDVSAVHAKAFDHTASRDSITNHEGIHPTPRMIKEDMDHFRAIVLKPVFQVDENDADMVEDLMVVMIARRCFEALRETSLARGVFHPREDSDLTALEMEALADLDWFREIGQRVPWSKSLATGLKVWPLYSLLVEGMMMEDIGRPSTMASHAFLIEEAGHIRIPTPGSLPQLTQSGARILKALPRGSWSPATCRMIEKHMSEQAEGEDVNADITNRMRARVDKWFSLISPEIRVAMVDILKAEADTSSRTPAQAADDIAVIAMDPDLGGHGDDGSEMSMLDF